MRVKKLRELLKELSLLKVTFFAAVVLLLEIVFFHLLNYVHDYYMATLVIGLVVVGLGSGAFTATIIKKSETEVFTISCTGTTIFLYISSLGLVLYPTIWLISLLVALCFFFPALYIALIFKNHRTDLTYMYDLVGAGLGVFVTVFLYRILGSEAIILLILVVLPIVGLLNIIFSKGQISQKYLVIALIPLFLGSCFLLHKQVTQDSFNIFKIINDEISGLNSTKVFVRYQNTYPVKTYDNLVERIDLIKRKKRMVVNYNGYSNDHFTKRVHREYDNYFKDKKSKWPTNDRRVFYGIVNEPKIFVIGSAAQGIIKSIKKITPRENIFAIEINPAITQIMTQDYYDESGKAYAGLDPITGNALSILKANNHRFDIITLINAHSTPTISYPGRPDYLHTIESYDLYFDHLGESGYLLFEERPINRSGELGLYRMINTLWNSLEKRGVENPSEHFVIWEWMGDKRGKRSGRWKIRKGKGDYYVSMLVFKQPIVDEYKEIVSQWFKNKNDSVRISYAKDIAVTPEYKRLFKMIENNNFEELETEDFDTTLVTNDRPFPAVSTKSIPTLNNILLVSGIIGGALWLFFTIGLNKTDDKENVWKLNFYNILIGFAYFFPEIIFIQNFQNIFIGPSMTLILVLGCLLVSSGIGGYFSTRFDLKYVTIILIPIMLLALYIPNFFVRVGVQYTLIQISSVLFIVSSGFLMGMFFPRGLNLAKQSGLQNKIPHLFAINAISSSFAVVLALYLGIKIGYQYTLLIAIAFYIIASLLLYKVTRKVREREQAKANSSSEMAKHP